MDNMPLISVIVPVYNTSAYLKDCLNSLVSQTIRNLEIILVNDGSTDDSDIICREFQRRDNRIKYYYQTNQGVSSARNNGIVHSNGKYIGFVDSDDVVSPDMYELLLRNMNSAAASISVCRLRVIYSDKVYSPKEQSHFETISRSDAIRKFFTGELDFSANNKLYSAKLLDGIKFEGTLNEDILFNCKCLLKSDKVVVQHAVKYDYLVRESSKKSTLFEAKYLESLKVAENMMTLVRKHIMNGELDYDCIRFASNYNLVTHISLFNLIVRTSNHLSNVMYNQILSALRGFKRKELEPDQLKAKHLIALKMIQMNPRIYSWMFQLTLKF